MRHRHESRPCRQCYVSATFTPTANGTVTAQVNFTDNATGSPHVVTLTGTGIPTAISAISVPTALAFGDQIINTGGVQTLDIVNSGSAPLNISSIAVSGTNAASFVASGSCTTIAVGTSCPIILTFTPATVGVKTATVTIVSDASNQPTATVALTGNGILAPRPIVELSVTAIGFGNSIFGGATAGQVVTLRNVGGAPLSIQSIFTSGDFVVMHSCPASPRQHVQLLDQRAVRAAGYGQPQWRLGAGE